MAVTEKLVETLACEKADAFLLDEPRQTLRALGTSNTPLGRRQKALGLDVLALANGGRIVEVFNSGESFLEARADQDDQELRGIVVALGVRSTLSAAIYVNGVRRGVLTAASTQPDFFQPQDLAFLEAVAHWTGVLTHQAELAHAARKSEAERARRAAADEIITVLAHDFRNHLHPLLGRLQLMRLQLASGKGVERNVVEAAIRSVERLSRLTSDLLDLRRLDEGLFTLSFVPTDLVVLAAETAAGLGTTSTRVVVTGLDSLIIIADAERLRQALENLVANGVRYSPAGKNVEIRVTVGEHLGMPRAVMEVIDSGPGIPPDVLPGLFDRFRAGPDSAGLGLGLYLAHRIASLHGGELSVESKLGVGTKFRLTLPFPDAAGHFIARNERD